MKRFLFITLPALLATGISVYVVKNAGQNAPSRITCISKLVEMSDEGRQDLLMTFHFDREKQTGEVIMEGRIASSDGSISAVNRQVLFRYTRSENYYTLTSGEINSIRGESVSAATLRKRVPDFFVKENRVLSYNISRVKDYGYVFSVASVPRFFCQKE